MYDTVEDPGRKTGTKRICLAGSFLDLYVCIAGIDGSNRGSRGIAHRASGICVGNIKSVSLSRRDRYIYWNRNARCNTRAVCGYVVVRPGQCPCAGIGLEPYMCARLIPDRNVSIVIQMLVERIYYDRIRGCNIKHITVIRSSACESACQRALTKWRRCCCRRICRSGCRHCGVFLDKQIHVNNGWGVKCAGRVNEHLSGIYSGNGQAYRIDSDTQIRR